MEDEIKTLFDKDYEKNIKDFIYFRWFFRKSTKISEFLGNTLLYVGSCLSSIASGISLVPIKNSQNITNLLLFISTGMFSTHIMCIAFAKYMRIEEIEKENQLQDLVSGMKDIKIIPLIPSVNDTSTSSQYQLTTKPILEQKK